MQHNVIEKNLGIMGLFICIVISFGGMIEIIPLFFDNDVQRPISGLKPLTALELSGRDVYIKEGCHVCHTQMIRSLSSDVMRYGNHSIAGEFVYEHPFLWGSKRTGPDLARVGKKYSDGWHRAHFQNPRLLVPASKMPAYKWLSSNLLDENIIDKKMIALKKIGVPYTNDDIKFSKENIKGKSEEDALIAYLQQLGVILKNI
ncbi:MAG: cytochrome-c oxidase, cbb3-type subunit II [Candidatus Azosocius agrarius]|nr:MAG: cytochrome-c oxidase, cbb3-type subunit II [Gammaproteobacteria bacterium]